MTIITKSNGYEISEELKNVIARFEEVAVERFGEESIEKIEHFYYGDKLSMTDIRLTNDRHYGNFNITGKSVHLCGLTCTKEESNILASLCWNDECYKQGNLF